MPKNASILEVFCKHISYQIADGKESHFTSST